MTRVNRWECDQCGAHITGKERLYRVKLEEPVSQKWPPPLTAAVPGDRVPRVRCRKKDMCHACFDKVVVFLDGRKLMKKEEEKGLKDRPFNIQLSTIERIRLEEEKK